jgi:hypothetical protein
MIKIGDVRTINPNDLIKQLPFRDDYNALLETRADVFKIIFKCFVFQSEAVENYVHKNGNPTDDDVKKYVSGIKTTAMDEMMVLFPEVEGFTKEEVKIVMDIDPFVKGKLNRFVTLGLENFNKKKKEKKAARKENGDTPKVRKKKIVTTEEVKTDTATSVEVPVKKKRRTKAEMEAARAAGLVPPKKERVKK